MGKVIIIIITAGWFLGISNTILPQKAEVNKPVTQTDARNWCSDVDYMISRIEIMHPDPYAFISKKEFYNLKEKFFAEIPNMSETDIVISIAELLARLKDGHTRWALEQSNPQWLENTFHILPVLLYPFKDGTYIIAALPPYAEFTGMKVLKIGDMPVSEVLSKLGKMWSGDNPYGEKKYLYYSLCISEFLKKSGAVKSTDEIEILLQNEKGGEIKTIIKPVSFMSMVPFLAGTWYPHSINGLSVMNDKAVNALPLWLKNQDKYFWYEYMPEEKIMFLQINSLNFPHGNSNEEGEFGSLCNEFFRAFDQSKAEKLVIDIRRNTGGNHVEMPLVKGILARPQIDKPDKLFLITGRVTFSAAVHLTTVLKKNTNITIIGEPGGGRPNHYGANRSFKLPNHPHIQICTSIDYYQDSEPFDFNIINTPVIWAEMNARDYAENTDPALNAVLNYGRIESLAASFLSRLEKAYSEKGIPGIKDEYGSFKPELLNCGYSIEKFLSDFYETCILKNVNDKPDLLEYLYFAAGECPESIDFKYALAFQYDSNGKLNEAETMYNECLKINPAHHYAKMRLGLLKLK
ncbi:MAG: hypothetical protein V1720_12335 [bacterium]